MLPLLGGKMRNLVFLLVLVAGLGSACVARNEKNTCVYAARAAEQTRQWGDALSLCRKRAAQGYEGAQYTLGVMYAQGLGVTKDSAEAVKWFRAAAAQGVAAAQHNLGQMYRQGLGVTQDYAEAMKWYRKAAEQAEAQTNLGWMYIQGLGVTKDYAEAMKWFRKAADQGDAQAQKSLGVMYEQGLGVTQDYAEAMKWFRKAADQGDTDAQLWLGWMYEKGLGVTQDYAEAIKWFRKAAAQGHARAQYNLGQMYRQGLGVTQDYAEAMKSYRMAAERGDADAQNSLGVMYEQGYGVTKYYPEAIKWFRKAAAQGHERAQTNLERVYRKEAEQSHAVAQNNPERVYRNEAEKRDAPATGVGDLPQPAHASRQTVRHIQERLTELGYDPGPPDGIAGRKTQVAIRRFQTQHGLPVTGEASDELAREVQVAIAATERSGSPNQKPSKPIEAETAAIEKKPEPELHATGTGFAVTTDGRAVTNHHVVKGCAEVRSPPVGTLKILAVDARNDLALLQMEGRETKAANFRQGRGVRPGDDVVVAGFPLHGLLASDLNITTGNVSALAGPGDDRRYLQITAPVQPGNSGGPLLDLSGNVVGVVVGKLDALLIAGITGDIPQNVNFAISAGTVRAFLDAHNVPYELSPSETRRTTREVADQAREYTILVECWK
jgi:TPR repeat protein